MITIWRKFNNKAHILVNPIAFDDDSENILQINFLIFSAIRIA